MAMPKQSEMVTPEVEMMRGQPMREATMLAADTAGGGSHRIVIPYLPAAEARAVFDDLSTRVDETAFRW